MRVSNINTETLYQALRGLTPWVSDVDGPRGWLRFEAEGHTLSLIATNGHVLYVVRAAACVEVPGVTHANRASAKALTSHLRSMKKRKTLRSDVLVQDGALVLDGCTTHATADAPFPPYHKVIPSTPMKRSAGLRGVDPEYLASAGSLAQNLGLSGIRMHTGGELGPTLFEGEDTARTVSVTLVVMPQRT